MTSVRVLTFCPLAVLVFVCRQNGVDPLLDRIFEEVVCAFNCLEEAVRIDHGSVRLLLGESRNRVDSQDVTRIGDADMQFAVFNLKRNELRFFRHFLRDHAHASSETENSLRSTKLKPPCSARMIPISFAETKPSLIRVSPSRSPVMRSCRVQHAAASC